jgi:hypothetical protein
MQAQREGREACIAIAPSIALCGMLTRPCIAFPSSLTLAGTAGGEAQQNDIKQLRRELELKKSKLNELCEETRKKEAVVAKLKDDNTDCTRLTPEQLSGESDYVTQLQDEMKRIDEDLTEAEAKNRLYYLLGERTR